MTDWHRALPSRDAATSALAAATSTRQRAARRPERTSARILPLHGGWPIRAIGNWNSNVARGKSTVRDGVDQCSASAGAPPGPRTVDAPAWLLNLLDAVRGIIVSSGAPVTGCLPLRSARRRACHERSCLPTRLPPDTAPRHGWASEPHRSHHSTLPEVTRLCV